MEIKPHKKSSKNIKGPIQIHKILFFNIKLYMPCCNATKKLTYTQKNQEASTISFHLITKPIYISGY